MTSVYSDRSVTAIAIGLLFVATTAEGANKVVKSEVQNETTLRAELRANENGMILLDTNPKLANRRMHFILHSTKNGTQVYRADNSWGDSTRAFDLVQEHEYGMVYRLQRRSQEYAKNAPMVREINKGEFLITEINFCDGTWRIDPLFQPERSRRLFITGHFEIKPGGVSAWGGPVWTGKISSNTLEVYLELDCRALLNNRDP